MRLRDLVLVLICVLDLLVNLIQGLLSEVLAAKTECQSKGNGNGGNGNDERSVDDGGSDLQLGEDHEACNGEDADLDDLCKSCGLGISLNDDVLKQICADESNQEDNRCLDNETSIIA